jgi:hypothetical protein
MNNSSRNAHFVRVFFLAVQLTSCSSDIETSIAEYGHIKSPDGDAEAYVYENSADSKLLTQVTIKFPGNCYSGAVAAYRSDLKLELRWENDETLEVRHPQGVDFERNASGETVQCFSRKVHVRLVPREN